MAENESIIKELIRSEINSVKKTNAGIVKGQNESIAKIEDRLKSVEQFVDEQKNKKQENQRQIEVDRIADERTKHEVEKIKVQISEKDNMISELSDRLKVLDEKDNMISEMESKMAKLIKEVEKFKTQKEIGL
jgi:hypothetical protein